MRTVKDFEKWVTLSYPLIDDSDYNKLDHFDMLNFSNWSGLFDSNGEMILAGDKVFVFGEDSEIVFELGSFCYTFKSLNGFFTVPINGSPVTIDSDFKCLEIIKK